MNFIFLDRLCFVGMIIPYPADENKIPPIAAADKRGFFDVKERQNDT